MMSPVIRAAALLIAFALPAAGETRLHYAPRENLEHVDVALLNGARETIDFAGYIVTDRPVIDALNAAKARGVSVRLLLDHTQRHDLERLTPVLSEARKKRHGPIMHLKAYLIDGRFLRTGSANFTASGLKQQDNDLAVIDEPVAVARFEQNFESMWDAAVPVFAEAPPASVSTPPAPVGLLSAPQRPRAVPSAAAYPSACVIKGNVNRKGEHIYHMPDQLDYGRVVMEGRPEKRWFCTEEEAVAAGWRKAIR